MVKVNGVPKKTKGLLFESPHDETYNIYGGFPTIRGTISGSP